MRIHWIASFPKSGNTWVRFLLYHYFYGELTDTVVLGRRIPDVHAGDLPRADSGTRTLLVKTHWGLNPKMPHVERTAGAVYIIRHPKDVVLSLLNFYRLSPSAGQWTDEAFVRNFIQQGADAMSLHQGFGAWESNVMSWVAQQVFPLLLVRYEDLKADAAAQLRRIVGFLGEPLDESRIQSATAASTFERMRELEAREKSADRKSKVFAGGKAELQRGVMFMNKGGSGQTLASIGPTLDREFDERYGTVMWLLGYGPRR